MTQKKKHPKAKLEELRAARLTVNSLKDEINDRSEDEDDKEAPEDTEYQTNSKYDSPIEEYEAGCRSDSSSVDTVDYGFPTELSETKSKPREMGHKISKSKDVEENDDTIDLNVIEQIKHQSTPPSSKRTRSKAPPPPGSTGTRSRASPQSAKG